MTTLAVGEVNLSEAARRLTEIKACEFTYREVSAGCKLLAIPVRQGPGNQRFITAADFFKLVRASERELAPC